MVLCSVECVQRVSQYLKVSPGNLYISENNVVASDSIRRNQSIEGFSTIVQALAKNTVCPDNYFGSDAEKRALTRQWLEYAVLHVNYADNSANSKRILKELNDTLKSNTYLTGTERTLADICLYYMLHAIMKDLNPQEKAQYMNVSRWFDNVQQDPNLRQKLELFSYFWHEFIYNKWSDLV